LVEKWRKLHEAELLANWVLAAARRLLTRIEPLESVMVPRLIEAKHAGGYRVWLRFKAGTQGETELGSELWGEVFEPLKDPAEFAKLRADKERQTLVWPNGADFAPEWLWDQVKAAPAGRNAAE
jgi:Protein of unknown function (DUF2442)